MKSVLTISDICARLTVIADIARASELAVLIDPGSAKHAAAAVSVEILTLNRQSPRQAEVIALMSVGAYRGEPDCGSRLERLEATVTALVEARA